MFCLDRVHITMPFYRTWARKYLNFIQCCFVFFFFTCRLKSRVLLNRVEVLACLKALLQAASWAVLLHVVERWDELHSCAYRVTGKLSYLEPFSSVFFFFWHLCTPPLPHSWCQIKCQTEREGRLMAHFSKGLLSGAVCSSLGPAIHATHPGSLVADWVVIVIRRSCTSRENTELSASGWSGATGWAAGISLTVHSTTACDFSFWGNFILKHRLYLQCMLKQQVAVFFYAVYFAAFVTSLIMLPP